MALRRARRAILAAAGVLCAAAPALAQAPTRSLGQIRLNVVGVSATLDPLAPVVPKNTASAVRIVVKSGESELTAADLATFLGTAGFKVEALLSGPGLPFATSLPQLDVGEPLPADPLMLPLPPLRVGGDYSLSHIRVTVGGESVLEVEPSAVTLKVIDQILITSVKTRPLTLDEIKEKGIVLDSDDYLGFEFTMALSLDSKATTFTFPVVFNRDGVAIPPPITDTLKNPTRDLDIPQPFGRGGSGGIYATMLSVDNAQNADVPLTTPKGEPIRIPSLLVIPGHVGYLKQFFSAQLFVANGAPVGSGLNVKNVTGTISLPLGKDGIPSSDDPLALPEITRDGQTILQPRAMDVMAVGADGQGGTPDDVSIFAPGEQGQAEFLLRGEAEGFHTIDFDIAATLEGLPVGPVKVKGKASGGVLVRNPYFDMTFTVPSVVRRQEQFKVFVNVTNIGKGAANLVDVELDSAAMSGLDFGTYPDGHTETPSRHIDTIGPGDTKSLEFLFRSQKTGQVVATYLKLDTSGGGAGSGKINFTIGVGERGVPLSPDTLVLPTSVEMLPQPLTEAVMRILGQGWSIAGAAPGTLPAGVIKTTKTAVTIKALAYAEAGLRVQLGQDVKSAIRDLIFDFYGGDPIDPGFDQLLRQTEAGRDFARALGAELGDAVTGQGPIAYERDLARLAASGPDFLSFAVAGSTPVDVALVDVLGHKLVSGRLPFGVPEASIPGGVIIPAGDPATAPLLGVITAPSTSPYTITLSGPADFVVTYPRGDGTFRRAPITTEGPAQVVVDLSQPDVITLRQNLDDTRDYETETTVTPSDVVMAEGPHLLTANVIGPETLQGGNPLGLYAALLFDRVVDAGSAAVKDNYAIPSNAVQAAKRQLSGRLVFAALEQPEGPYVPTTLTASGVADMRAVLGPTDTVPMGSRLDTEGAVVIGRVVSADGTPVAAGAVYYSNHQSSSCETGGTGNRVSRVPLTSDGRYELRYVRRDPCGRPFGVSTNDPVSNFERSITAYVRHAGERMVLDLALLGKGAVSGTVRDLTGAVVPGALVVALSGVDTNTGGNTTTDGQGHYTVSNITVGPVTVKAGKGTGIGSSSGRIERAGTTATVDVNIDYGGAVRVSGVVRRTEGGVTEVVPGALVVDTMPGGPVGYAWTDTQGKYVLENMPVGPFTISSHLGGYATGTGFKGADLKIDLLIDAGGGSGGPGFGVVKGVVRLPDGSPAAGAVVAQDISGTVVFDGTVSGADGRFALAGIKAGEPVQIGAITMDRTRTGYTYATVDPVTLEANNVVITLSGTGTIEFQVLGANGLPVTGQDVSLFDQSMTLGGCHSPCGCTTAKTGPDGRARFFGRPIGGITAQAIRFGDGFVDVAQGTAQIRRDGEIGFGVIQFRGTGTVTGKVIPPEGVFATGGEVRVSSLQFENDGLFNCGLTLKESHRGPIDLISNEFRFPKVLVGPVYISVSHPLFPQVSASGNITAAGQVLNFNLQLVDTIAGVLSGVVYLPDGTTPAGAGVEVTANGPVPDVMVKTDATGKYRFAKVFPQGTYSVTARDPRTGGLSQETVYLRAREDQVHDQRLKGRGTVRVRVVDGSDQPVANAFVILGETDFPRRSYEGAVEESNQGLAVVEGVFEGPFSISASDTYGRGGRTSGTITRPGDTVDVTVRLTAVGTVRGRFVMPDRLTPVPFGVVRLVNNGRVIGQTTTPGSGDQLGAFLFDYVPAGDVRVEGQDPLTLRTGASSGRIDRDGQEVVLDVVAQGLGTVQGVVRSHRNGGALEPEPGAHVDVESAGYKSATATDASGRYVVEGIPEGAVTVTASLNGFLRGTATATLAGDATVADVDVVLQDSARVTGTVIKAGTTATPGPVSPVTFQSSNGSFRLTRSSDEEGRFQFDRVPVGHADVFVDVPNSLDEGRASVDVTPGEVDVPIVLNGVGSISGIARDFAGNPVPGRARIVAQGAVGYWAEKPVGTNGVFLAGQVPAGPFVITVTGLGDFPLSGSTSFTVLPDEAKQVEVRLQPSGTVTGLVVRPDGVTPALGADVTVQLTPNRGSTLVQALGNGRFSLPNVPLGDVQVQVRDNLTAGVARKGPLALTGDVLDFGTIVLDDTPVSVASVDPPDGATGIQPSQIVRVTFTDPLQSTAGVEVRDGTQTQNATATLSLDGLTLSLRGTWPDARDLTVVATTAVRDVYGRSPAQAFTSHFHTADLSPPYVTSIAPAFNAIQVDVGSSVSVVFNEPLGEATNLAGLVVVTGPGGANVLGTVTSAAPGTVTFTPAAPLAANASYTVTVAGAVDVTGNRQTSPFVSSFKTTDTFPPTLTLHDPPDGSWVRSPRPQFYLSMSDTLSGLDVSTAVLAIDAHTVPAVRGSNTLTYVPAADLAEGEHTLGSSVRDNATNLTTLASTFRIDSVPPSTPVVTGLVEGQTLRGALTVSATATDASSGIARVELLSDGVVFLILTPPSLQATYGTGGLSEGPHTITARSIDVAGNPSASTTGLHVVVDNQVLTLAITSPPEGTPLSQSVTVRATVSEPVTRVEFSVGTVVATDAVAPYEATLPLASIAEGSAIVKAKAVPAAGDPAFAQVQVVVDRTAPAAPDGSKITAVSDGTNASVQGAPGAVEASLRVEVTNLATTASGAAYAAGNGAFGLGVQGVAGHTLSLTVLDPAGNRSAATTVVVTPRPVGTIHGRVLQPDGTTAAPGVAVTLAGFANATSATPDGGFSFANVPLGSYTLEARVGGRLRAQVSPVGLSSGGQEVEQNLTLVGVGTVTGLVTEFSGAPVASARVTLNSQAPRFGGQFTADTDATGHYTIADVPLGDFSVAVVRGPDRADGGAGIPEHGDVVTVNLRLVSAAVNLPVNLVDGNGLTWQVGASGSVGAPWGMFDGSSPRLSLVQGGTTFAFSGSGNVGASEEAYREIVVRQSGLAGLDVTRKVYVPNDGYFVRHVDTLTNPGSAPVTVDLKVELGMGPIWTQATRIVASSSGDTALDTQDRWAVFDDDVDDADVFDGNWHFAPLPVVFRGQGGTAPAALTFDTGSRQVTSRWNAITVAPGQSVSVLYAYTAQADRTRAAATATRLVSLPPEELQGLGAGEAAAIGNFQVPGDLVSALLPLPLVDGAVGGQLFAWDGVTPSVGAPYTSGVFRSRSSYYGRPLFLSVDGGGAYALRADVSRTDAGKRLVPREPFDVTFITQQIGKPSASATGSFAITGNADLTTTAGRTLRVSSTYSPQYGPEAAVDGDVNTAWYTANGDAANRGGAPFFEVVLAADATIRQVRVRGTRTSDSYTVRRARIEVRDGAGTVSWSTEADFPPPLRDGDVLVPAVVGRSVRVVSLVDVSGTPGLAEVEVIGDGMSGATGRARADVSFTGTAILTGRVQRADGSAVGGGALIISNGAQSSQYSTDGGGSFRLLHVPPATYTLTALHPQGQASAVATVVVGANQTLARDLVFPAFGAIAGVLRTATGGALGSSYVDLEGKGRYTYTNAAGAYAFADVPPGPYRVRAFDSTRSNIMRTADVAVTAGDTAAADFAFPPVGTVQVTVRADGTAVTGVALRWRSDSRGPDFVCCGSTDSLGKVTFTNVVGPEALVQVGNPSPSTYVRGEATVSVAEGQISSLTLDVPGAGTVTGTVRSRDGSAVPFQAVYALHSTDPVVWSSTTANGAGSFSLGFVIEGAFRLQGRRVTFYPAVGTIDTRAEVRGTMGAQGTTVALDALLPLGALTVAGQRDLWEIEVAAGQNVDVLAVGTALGARPALADPHLAIYAPNGALLGESDDISATDHNSRVHVTAGAAGRYVVVVNGAGTQTGGYELISPSHVLRPYGGATIEGTLTRDLDGAPAPGHAVRITPSALTVVTSPSGHYAAPLLVVGPDVPVTVQALDPEGVVVAGTTVNATEGQNAVADLTVPVRESVTVTVRRGPLPLAGVTVSLESDHAGALAGDRLRARVTGGDGTVSTNLPVGNVAAHVTDSGTTYSATGVLVEGTPLSLEVVVPPGLTVLHGTVRAGDNQTPLPGIAVELSGVGTTATDGSGVYRFEAVPAGTYTLTASTGAISVPFDLTLSGGDVTHDFVLPVGFVAGRVSNTSNASVAGAIVTATAANGTFTGTTGSDGRYRIAPIAPGPVTVAATDPATGATGTRAGTLAASGQTLNLDITVQLVGTVKGTVLRAGGTMPAAGVDVHLLNSGLGLLQPPVTSDAQGLYTFSGVPLGSFYVDVTDPANGDRGRASNQLNSSGETRTVNVTMTGVGRAIVKVVDASNNPVVAAEVTVQSQTGLAPARPGTSGADGTVTFENVLAGGISVTAHHPVTGLNGSTSATVPVGGPVQVTVTLQPAGTFQGRVLIPGGGTGVAGAQVRLLYSGNGVARETSSDTDGNYRFEGVALNTYTLEVVWQGKVRARATNLALTFDGQVITRDLELVGVGTVHGTVRNPGGSVAPNLAVTLKSLNAQIGSVLGAITNSAGVYQVAGVPVGAFTVSATSGQNGAEVPGYMPEDGADVTVDVQLQNNTLNLPTNLYDANNFVFNIQTNASVAGGTNSVYQGDFSSNRGGFLLDVIAGGTATRFSATATVVPTEQGYREIVTTQAGLAGLTVTRKVFVPLTGYMARYLELLRNPGPSPVTVDLRVVSNIRQFSGLPRVITTSSGDDVLSVADDVTADRWVVLDDGSDGDPFLVSTLPATAFVFDGPGGAQRASQATWTTLPSSGVLAYQWTGVTVDPGQTVAFLHFGTQQTSRAAAQASAERLVQLPPEALDGLSVDEIGAIRNFAVPADGTSLVKVPLPALAGAVTGRLVGHDGQTPVAYGNVQFKSHNILFGRTYSTSANGDGRFNFTASVSNFGSSMAIPADEFGLVGRISDLVSPEAVGSFPPGQLTATKDVPFTNAGVLRGTVKRYSGAGASNASVYISRPGQGATQGASTDPAGSFAFGAVSGGPNPGQCQTYNVSATWYPPSGGTALQASTDATICNGQTTTVALVLPPTGKVTGTVTTAGGSAAASIYVRLSNSSVSRQVYTDGAGRFTLDDVPEGDDYTLGATENSTGVETRVFPVTVGRDQTTTRDLVLNGVGSVQVHVSLAGGVVGASGSHVNILEDRRGYQRSGGDTNASGNVTITNVSVGTFTVTAYHPQNTAVSAQASGSVASHGSTVPVTVTLQAMGTVRATVLRGSTRVPGASVNIRYAGVAYFTYAGSTDSAGVITIPYVPQGPFTVQAVVDGLVVEESGEVFTDGSTVDVTLALPDNPVGLPTLLYDANAFDFGLREDGTFEGRYQVFAGDWNDNHGASRLDVIAGGAAMPFTGAHVGSLEDDGREVVIGQSGLAGLNVTRKVFVPRSGYFARYVDVLRNPGPTPVTVDVRILSHISPYWGVAQVVATSSGDATLSVEDPAHADRWVTLDDGQDQDPFEVYNAPAAAFVFGGEGAVAPASEAVFEPTSDFSRVSFRWNAVTVPPGGSVAYMHFDVQETSRAAAATAAERLSHLPPEALDGLSEAERAAVGNFAIPADGSSPLERVAAVDGIVTGLVLAGDHDTRIPSASVKYHSLHPLFERTYSFTSDASGVFVAASRFDDGNPPVAVPRDAFVLHATHPMTGVEAPPTFGSFAPGEATAFQDIVFSTTGVLRGTVRRHDQTPIGQGSVRVTRANGTTYYGSIGADGTYVMTGLLPGSYTVVAELGNGLRATATASVAAGEATTADLTLPATGTVTGLVRTADGQAIGSTYVFIEDGAGYSDSRYTSAGQFTFTDVPVGNLTIRVQQPGYGWYAGPFPVTVAAGETVNLSLRLDAVANIHLRVQNRDGSPLVSAYVYIRPYGQGYASFAGYTDASGAVLITGVREGPFSLLVYRPSTSAFFGSTQGTVSQGDHGHTLEALITAGFQGRVQGRVTAGDGVTPLSSAYVTVNDAATDTQVGWSYTDSDGHYAVDPVVAGAQGFVVRAQYYAQGSAAGAFTSDGDSVTVDVVVPVSVVHGTVTFHDGEPVPYPQVFAIPLGPSDVGTLYGQGDELGRFTLVGVTPGPFRLVAHDSTSGLTTTIEATVTSVSTPLDLDVVLPASGNVVGHVRDENGDAMANVEVVLVHPALEFDRWVTSDDTGQYRVERVAVGSFLLEACERDDQGLLRRCGRAQGTLAAEGDTVTVDVALPALASLGGTVLDAGGAAHAGAIVTAESLSGLGVQGTVLAAVTADDNGQYSFPAFPAGPVRIFADPDDAGLDAGLVSGTVSVSGSVVDVTIGNATRFQRPLDGADGWRYDIQCDGGLFDGGRVDGSTLPSFAGDYGGAVRVNVGGVDARCRPAALLSASGRETDFDYSVSRALRFERKVFVPAVGGFARYLEIITNVSGEPATTSVVVSNTHAFYDDSGHYIDGPYTAVDPATTGGTYAIVAGSGGGGGGGGRVDGGGEGSGEGGGGAREQAVVGSVFAGPGARTPVAETDFESYNHYHSYRWDITVPAHSTVALLHFTTQGAPNDVASAQGRAQALVDLSLPDALAGITDEEAEEILNFAVPAANDRAGVRGHVQQADGTPVEGASVRVLSAADGTTVATKVTDPNGAFRATPLPPGSYVVVADDPATGKSAQQTADVAPNTVVEVTLTLPEGQGVRGVVRTAMGVPVSGATVSVFRSDFSQFGPVTTDADGRFEVLGLDPGDYTVIATDPATTRPGQVSVTVSQGQLANVIVSLLADDAVGDVHVTGVIESTGAPAAFAPVILEVDGWFESILREVTLDGSGQATVSGLPVGLVFATSGAPPEYGWTTAMVPATGTAEAELRIGSRPAFPIDLTGADGMPYFARASSVLTADGTTSDWDCPVFCVGYSSLYTSDGVNHEYHQQAGALVSSGGREVTVGPDFLGPIRATRRTFVPPAGRFARFFDVFENTSAEPVPLTYYVEQAHNSPGAPWTVVTTSSGDEIYDAEDGYATMATTTDSSPAMAFVTAGPDVSLERSPYTSTSEPFTWFVDLGGFVLEPGQKVAILRFVVQRPHGQMQEVEVQAEALRNLTDPDALVGLSAAERALVINFQVPEP